MDQLLKPPPHFHFARLLWFLAEEITRVPERWPRPAHPNGQTLRPGPATPRWNQLADTIAPLLRRRGAKAVLARELGLNRGRISEFFVQRSAMPDAERVLRLLEWVAWRLAEDRQRRSFRSAATARNTSNR